MNTLPFAARLAAEARAALQSFARPCLLLAALPAAGLIACTASPQLLRSTNPASADVLLALITLPMWLNLLLAGAGPVLAGRLDRWIASRALQSIGLVAGVTAFCVLSCDVARIMSAS
ncbi:hypothetical protein HLB44_15005 [Aquincola sp. S2]|uniref:MFS transporter n=1 Tax=Pseudaquabacterium terrae TaxID=2732868 RepID=A0ABX2EI48_9BURK|nr:hypothetical protein [Aquabacterium terrae]NRF68300.1 hypothetical protein [Aquabacterium terrae]